MAKTETKTLGVQKVQLNKLQFSHSGKFCEPTKNIEERYLLVLKDEHGYYVN